MNQIELMTAIAKLIDPAPATWLAGVQMKDEAETAKAFLSAFSNRLGERTKKQLAQSETDIQAAQLSARQAHIRANIVQGVEQLQIATPSLSSDPEGYARIINAFASMPEFRPENWQGEGANIHPIDGDGNRLKTDDFFDADAKYLLEKVNPFGTRSETKSDDFKPSPERAKRDYAKQREKLSAAGDKKGLLELSKKFTASLNE